MRRISMASTISKAGAWQHPRPGFRRHASAAHTEVAKNNNVVLELEKMDAWHLGYLFYFFERACAMSAYLNEVNPFNQPGVEIYKKNMFHLLGKPGYEK
jgi:glucose-6-phosphate isomerase